MFIIRLKQLLIKIVRPLVFQYCFMNVFELRSIIVVLSMLLFVFYILLLIYNTVLAFSSPISIYVYNGMFPMSRLSYVMFALSTFVVSPHVLSPISDVLAIS